MEVPRTNEDEDTVGEEETAYEDCSSAADTTASMCRSLASIVSSVKTTNSHVNYSTTWLRSTFDKPYIS